MPLTLLPKFSLLKTKYRLENEKKEKKKNDQKGFWSTTIYHSIHAYFR